MNEQDQAAFQAWKESSDPDARTFEDAFSAGLAHARKAQEAQEMTELQALRVIALAVGPAAFEKSEAEMLTLDKEWHQACLSDSVHAVSLNRRLKEANAKYNALCDAMRVLEKQT